MRLYNNRKKENLFHWQYCATQKAAMHELTTTTDCKTHFIWVGMKNYKSFRGLYLLGIFRSLSKCHCKTTKRRGHSMNSTARRSLKRSHGFIMEQEITRHESRKYLGVNTGGFIKGVGGYIFPIFSSSCLQQLRELPLHSSVLYK